MYISPPMTSSLKTGSVVINKTDGEHYLVVCPACDLVVKGGIMRSPQIQICMIDRLDSDFILKAKEDLSLEILDTDKRKVKKNKEYKKKVADSFFSNITCNRNNNYHYLPPTEIYRGGLVNFRKVKHVDSENFNEEFNGPLLNISSSFVKDIVARYSSYYARQGQPDFNFTELKSKLLSL